MTLTARYADKCAAECGEPIERGDAVAYVDDQLVHDGCVPVPVAERAPRPTCPECFTELALNGACACP